MILKKILHKTEELLISGNHNNPGSIFIQSVNDSWAIFWIISNLSNLGKLLFGYARLPGINFNEPILSPLLPVVKQTATGFDINVEVQNFGQVASEKASIKIDFVKGKKEIDIVSGKVPVLKPFEKSLVKFKCGNLFEKGMEYVFKVTINQENKRPVVLHGKLSPQRVL